MERNGMERTHEKKKKNRTKRKTRSYEGQKGEE